MKYKELLNLMNMPASKNLGRDIPLLQNCISCTQNSYHSENVYEHCIFSFKASQELTTNSLLRLAILLHDVGKPTSKTIDNGETHFYLHELFGARLVYQYLRELNAPRDDIRYIIWCIRNHMWRIDSQANLKTIRKWLRNIGPGYTDLFTIRIADRIGNLANENKPIITENMRNLQQKIDQVIKNGGPIFSKDLAISNQQIKDIGIPLVKIDESIEKCWSVILNNNSQNNIEYLTNFLKRNYYGRSL